MKKRLLLALMGLLALGSSVFAAIDMPTPDYTDFNAGVGVVLGVVLSIMLAKRLKGFFR